MGNRNREIHVRGKYPLIDVREKIQLYDCIFLRHLRILISENRNYFHTLLPAKKELLDL